MRPVVGASAIAAAMARPRRSGRHRQLVGSIAESFPLPMAPSYAATKAGLRMFAQSLDMRMARHGVAVTLVSPGFIDTPMSRQVTEPKPFLMDADTAARIIARGIARRARTIVVPWQLRCCAPSTALLPRAVLRRVLSRV